MIEGRNVVAVVPARAGSKGVQGKNARLLGGKPLTAWPVLVAKRTPSIDRIIVSTDGEEIARIARDYGAEVYERPVSLAGDDSPVIDALRDLTDRLLSEDAQPDIMVLLEPTSPFRMPADISVCLERLVSEKLDSIGTFSAAHLNPHRAWVIEAGVAKPFIPGAVPWLPRQRLPSAWQLTGTVYAFDPMRLPADAPAILYGNVGAHVVDDAANFDIDTETDLKIANALFESSKLATLI